jgi:twitching motility protein PilI
VSETADQASAGSSGERLFAALKSVERRCRDHAAGMPRGEVDDNVWAGVLYTVGGVRLLSALKDVEEVLEIPESITRVPASQPWVRGIANNRGTLLPIFDLQRFLFDFATLRSPTNRVLVIRRDGPSYGLLVSEVIGIRHFEPSGRVSKVPRLGDGIDDFIEGAYGYGDQAYPVLSLQRLGVDTRFGNAAA